MLGLFTHLSLKAPTSDQFAYLKEYLSIMQPVSSYLDVMQGEAHSYLGSVLPILVKLRTKLRSLSLTVPTSITLRTGLLTSLDKRFGELFDNDAHIIAAIVHPQFKLHWLYFDAEKAEKYTDLVQDLLAVDNFENHCTNEELDQNQNFNSTAGTPVEELMHFPVHQTRPLSEFDQYLNDPREDLNMLDSYPNIKKMFIKYNTPIPSSAPVERLFSVANLILTSRRNRLSDLYFQLVLLLKIYFLRPDFQF